MWPQIIALMASYAVAYLNRPKMRSPKAAAFEDLELPLAAVGTPQYVIFGDVWINDMAVLTCGAFRTQTIKTRGGKKGGLGYWTGALPGIQEENERQEWHDYSDESGVIPEWDGVSPIPVSTIDLKADTWIPNS